MSTTRPSSSPWGSIQQCQSLDTGVYLVSTAGHGGIMAHPSLDLSPELKKLSLKHRTKSGTWLCFEEDCAAGLIILEWRLKGLQDLFSTYETESLVKSLSSYYPEFLIAKKITPDKERYDRYLTDKLRDKRAADKDPQLVVSRRSLGRDGSKMHIRTADGNEYVASPDGDPKSMELKDYNIHRDLTGAWTDSLREYLKDLPPSLVTQVGSLLQITPAQVKEDVLSKAYILVSVDENFEHQCTYYRMINGDANDVASLHVESFPDLFKEFKDFLGLK